MKITKIQFVSLQALIVILLVSIMVSGLIIAAQCHMRPGLKTSPEQLITTIFEIGPFAINSRYLSGEGPGRTRKITVGQLIASRKIIWPEPVQGVRDQNPVTQIITGQHLYWCRGAKLELIDEHGNVLPHTEYLCHSLIGFSGLQHQEFFPQSSAFSQGFVFNFTQGITNIMLPKGYGIPLNNNESLKFEFKALNRSSNLPTSIKCRWTLYFAADRGLTQPIKALNLFHSGISVLVGGSTSANRCLPRGCGGGSMHLCGMKGMSMGKDAPNDVLHRRLNTPFDKNEKGQEITWHWVVPPGRHSYRTIHSEHRFDREGPIRAAGAHVHPFCEKISMIEVRPGQPDKTVFTIYCRTDASQKELRISHIDYLTWPDGITLDKNAQYGWEVTYNNTSGVNQDAMAGVTLYFSDPTFQKPAWAL